MTILMKYKLNTNLPPFRSFSYPLLSLSNRLLLQRLINRYNQHILAAWRDNKYKEDKEEPQPTTIADWGENKIAEALSSQYKYFKEGKWKAKAHEERQMVVEGMDLLGGIDVKRTGWFLECLLETAEKKWPVTIGNGY